MDTETTSTPPADLSDWDEPVRPRRGRPEKHLDPETLLAVLARLDRGDGYKEACKRAGTSAHVVDKARAALDRVDFEIRVAMAKTGGRQLAVGRSCPHLVMEAALEAHRVTKGEGAPRAWEDVQRSLALRRDAGGVSIEAGVSAAAGEPLAIPDGDPAF